MKGQAEQEKRYAVKFFKDGQLLTIGHGKAKDELEAETRAEFALLGIYSNIQYDNVVVEEEADY